MHLLVCVVSNTALVNQIIAGWYEIGVTGATVIDSHGSMEIAADQVPVFAGFRHLLRAERQSNRTLFSVIKDDETLGAAMEVVEEACGSLDEPSTGIMFVLPASRVTGLAAKVQ
jgi:nitrogen regulatory protein P-II 1